MSAKKLILQKSESYKPKQQTEDFCRGKAYQKGMDTARKYFSARLPLLLTDEELGCLEVTLREIKAEGMENNLFLGNPDSGLIAPFIQKLLDVYTSRRVQVHGIKTMEQMGQLDFTHAGDQYVSPYEAQMEKVNYVPKGRR